MFSAPKGCWQSLNAGIFAIRKMDDEHLHKSIKMVKKNLTRSHYEKRGVQVSTEEAHGKLKELLTEQRRRKGL